MYGKIFESMYDGSLYGQWEAIVTFQQLIVIADKDGIVDMTPQALAGKTSIPLEIIEKGIELLSKPDGMSRTPDESGVRIAPLDDHRPWGWYIVNYAKYRDIATHADRRKQLRTYKRNQREREASGRSLADNLLCESPRQAKAKRSTTERFPEFWEAYPRRKDRARVEKVWKKNNLDELADKIILEVRWHAKNSPTWQKWTDNPDQEKPFQYVPYANKWLSGERWEDERHNDMPTKE